MPDPQPPSTEDRPKSLIGKILYSKLAGKISQIPPFSWIARGVARWLASRYRSKAPATAELRVHGSGLQEALDGIVKDVVEILGFAGAMVATFEDGEALPAKALYVDPQITTLEQIKIWEEQASNLIGSKVSLTDPSIARVYIYKPEHQGNLGVQAARSGRYLIRNELFDLFTPIAPDTLREFLKGIQDGLGIQQVITMPFFIKSSTDAPLETSTGMATEAKTGEFVGNLFAAKRGEITPQDIAVLSTFAQYIASFTLSERRRLQVEIIEKLILDIQIGLNSEEAVLQRIVKGIVDDLGYVGAMVATYNEAEDVLPARALYAGSNIAMEQIHVWEQQASTLIGTTLSLTDPNIAKVYLHQEEYKDNLSVKAAQQEKPVSSTDLFDLFDLPIVPDSLREFIKGIQEGLGIHRVIAVPFFLEIRQADGTLSKELVGNLFAASRSYEIQPWEIDILNAFGQQAAAGLRNVKLYKETQELYKRSDELYKETQELYKKSDELNKELHLLYTKSEETNKELQELYTKSEETNKELQALYTKSEDRRKATEIFGKMAFSASASVHALRNQLTSVKLTLQTLEALGGMKRELRDSMLDQIISSSQITNVLGRLEDMRRLIETLHEPWRPINDTIVDVNTSIKLAVDKVASSIAPWVKLSLTKDELNVLTTPEMLLEFFKVLIKNAVEAMPDENERCLEISSEMNGSSIEVRVSDHGIGMDPETLEKIFDMRFTTKEKGLGFGLFWAKDYIEGLSGSIQVESVPGRGTTFRISLPKLDSLEGQAVIVPSSEGD